ncbi:hypothetical protein DY037_01480 [Apilactobacillus micheneri]|uniref:hypothetical protein n=1 Tax=Apilactobacillus micheneri TaxID=1899430 RepID=UPI0011289BA8|nr:hypothetical protein [Apilactobacillus micheneri]TPR39117.1 hypothetical protein DY119_05500 [Apilactobacillus micheneri]TPR50648.1 hypothetical protein DY037_01480 [Apilactobacillus micheneri]
MFRLAFNYLKIIALGFFSLVTIFYFNETIQINSSTTAMGQSSLSFKMTYNYWDYYFIFSMLFLLPYVIHQFPILYKKHISKVNTYKDRAMRLHNQDLNQNHNNRVWSVNGSRMNNPYGYSFAETQSYGELSGSLLNFLQRYLVNIVVIIFAPIFIVFIIVKKLIKKDS